MSNVELKFHQYTDENRPKDGEMIMYVDDSEFHDSWEIRHGEVEWSWEEIDEDGSFTGTSMFYDPEEEQPESTVLVLYVDGVSLQKNALWAPLDSFWDQVEAHTTRKHP